MRIKLFEMFNQNDYYVSITYDEYSDMVDNKLTEFTPKEVDLINSLKFKKHWNRGYN
jgi:hypothetical protein